MIAQLKTSESEKYKILVLATLDYLIDRHTGEFVCDGFDPVTQYFEEQKVQAEKYRHRGQPKKLMQQLERLVEGLRHRMDFEFEIYIIERTGYDLDLFADLKSFGEKIVLDGKIYNETQSRKVIELIRLYNQQNSDDKKKERLEKILSGYYGKPADRRALNQGKTKVVKTEEKEGIITETIQVSFGSGPGHSEQREVLSPDGMRRLFISEYTGKDESYAVTSVNISFKTSSGGIYAVKGIHPDINAFWRNNNTVVIETSKSYTGLMQHRLVQSFQDVIQIEYVEQD